jgi:hypothetical protein
MSSIEAPAGSCGASTLGRVTFSGGWVADWDVVPFGEESARGVVWYRLSDRISPATPAATAAPAVVRPAAKRRGGLGACELKHFGDRPPLSWSAQVEDRFHRRDGPAPLEQPGFVEFGRGGQRGASGLDAFAARTVEQIGHRVEAWIADAGPRIDRYQATRGSPSSTLAR